MSEELSRRAETSSKRLSKAEQNALASLNRAMGSNFQRLRKAVTANYATFQELDRLPRQKAIALSKQLDSQLNLVPQRVRADRRRRGIRPSTSSSDDLRLFESRTTGTQSVRTESVFRNLYLRSQTEGTTLATDLLKQIGISDVKNAATNDFVDFWTGDSAGRLGDWGQKFKRDAVTIFELGMSQGWSDKRINEALLSRYGQLQQQAERIVKTGSVSAQNSTSSAIYKANGITLVQWQTSKTGADRTCNYCSPRNGNIYYIDKITYPLHPRERCSLLPVTRRNLLYGDVDRKYWQEQKAGGLKELKRAGGKPNFGLAPFEKRANRERPPKAIWQPDKGYSYGEKSRTRRLIDEP